MPEDEVTQVIPDEVIVEPEGDEEIPNESPLTKAEVEQLLADSTAKIDKRFKDTQAALTRSKQENAELRKRLDAADAAKPLLSSLIEERAEEEGWTAKNLREHSEALIAENEAKRGRQPNDDQQPAERDWQRELNEFSASNPKEDLVAMQENLQSTPLSVAEFNTVWKLRTGKLKVTPVAPAKQPVPIVPKGGSTAPAVNPKPVRSDMNSVLSEMRAERAKK